MLLHACSSGLRVSVLMLWMPGCSWSGEPLSCGLALAGEGGPHIERQQYVMLSLRVLLVMQDPQGEKFVARADPLAEASTLVEQLNANAAMDMRTHEAAYEISYRQDKPHVALKAVKRAQELDSRSPAAHMLLLRLIVWLEKRLPNIPIALAREGMQAELKNLTGMILSAGLLS